jgi:glycosyltransferase involved in cell wall biosynthesis
MEQQQKILSFSPYAFWRLHALYEVALCHHLKWKGHEFTYVGCDGLFTDCDIYWESTTGPRPADACDRCQRWAKQTLAEVKIPAAWLSKYRAADDMEIARTFTAALRDDELLTAKFDGMPVSSWVKSSVHTHFRANALDLHDKRHCATLRSYIYSGVLAARLIKRMFEDIRPTTLLLFNGRTSITRIAFELARAQGIRVICHERGMRRQTLLLWENEICLSLNPYRKLWTEWGGVSLTPKQIEAVEEWLLDRARGTNLNWKAYSTQSTLAPLEKFFEANHGRSTWGLFTSSTDETVSNEEYTSAFGTQQRWIEETVEFARQSSAIALVIRAHPNSGSKVSHGRNQQELAFFEGLSSRLPPNVALVMPDDPVSTYGLIDRCAVGLTYCSTVSLELACRGKKVISAARSFFTPCPAIRLVAAQREYTTLLSEYAASDYNAEDAEQSALAAFRFAYAYMYRWNRPFPLVHMPDVFTGLLTARTLDELRPGQHPCLDEFGEVVLGLRSAVPLAAEAEPPANMDPGAERVAVRRALAALSGRAEVRDEIKVSVIVPCFNHGRYLRDCITSVAAQNYRHLEVIVVNDGSTDDSKEVAEACLQEFPQLRIRIVTQANSGQPAIARNAGIRLARGEFILPLDADDQIDSGYLGKGMRTFEGNDGVDVVFADMLVCNQYGQQRKSAGKLDRDALKQSNQFAYCSLFRKSLWEKIGGYRENIRGYEDWDFWLAASLAGAQGAYLPAIGLVFNERIDGVYAQTIVQHTACVAQLRLNNPTAFSSAELHESRIILTNPGAEKRNIVVSVVIACAPGDAHLREAVNSVFTQTYRHWEIVIVNANGPDEPGRTARELVRSYPKERIRLLGGRQGNAAEARNAGVQAARGKYILTLDPEDKLHPEILAKGAALLDRSAAVGIAYSDWHVFGANNRLQRAPDYNYQALCTTFQAIACTSLFRKEAWTAAGGFNREMESAFLDWDFLVGCGGRYCGERIPEPLFYYREKEGRSLETSVSQVKRMFARIVLNHPRLYNAQTVEEARALWQATTVARVAPGSAKEALATR